MQSQEQAEEYENIRLLSYLQATAETYKVPITKGGEPANLNMYMTQAMQHQDMGVIILTPPLPKSSENKEAPASEVEEKN